MTPVGKRSNIINMIQQYKSWSFFRMRTKGTASFSLSRIDVYLAIFQKGIQANGYRKIHPFFGFKSALS